ncbi:MAG: phosphonate C-P lyase system protein PhnH [Alphaproteobacteria bacterium]
MTAPRKETLAAGLAEPVYDSQAVFRAVLNAFSRPGRIATVATGIEPPSPVHAATAAIALSLFDLSTPYWIDPALDGNAVIDYIGFHSGARPTETPNKSTFAILRGSDNAVAWDAFAIGTPDYPDRSTTLIIQVDDLREDGPVKLTGPGIKTEHHVRINGIDDAFWSSRHENAQLYPLGTDIILVAGARMICLPRTTRVEV